MFTGEPEKSISIRHQIACKLADELTLEDVARMIDAIQRPASTLAVLRLQELRDCIEREEYEALNDEDKAECDRLERERAAARERKRRQREKGRAG